jgi:hypothetical protein
MNSWHKEVFETTDFIKDFYSFWSKESRLTTFGIMRSQQVDLLRAIEIFLYEL